MAAHEHSVDNAESSVRRPKPVAAEPSEAVAPRRPASLNRAVLLAQLPGLQQTVGNAAVQRLVQRLQAESVIVQREEEPHIPLEVAPGSADSATEQEEETAVQRMPMTGSAPARPRRTRRLQRASGNRPVARRVAQVAERAPRTVQRLRTADQWITDTTTVSGLLKNKDKRSQSLRWIDEGLRKYEAARAKGDLDAARTALETVSERITYWKANAKTNKNWQLVLDLRKEVDDENKELQNQQVQVKVVKDLNASADVDAVKTTLLALQKKGTEWRVLRGVFKAVKDSVRDLIRADTSAKTLAFGLCPTAADKGELIYYLKGDKAWKQQAMTDNGIDDDTYREALVRLGVFEKGAAAHKAGPEVDALIGKHLKSYVEQNLEARGKVAGRVAVVGGDDWDIIGKKEWGSEWKEEKKTLNAFVDRSTNPPRVFVNKDRGNAGTAIHEGVHFWGSPARPINSDSHSLNEGVTEYFARKVCDALDPPIPRAVYAEEFAIASKMIDVVREDVVASAFFDGKLAPLKAAFRSEQRWSSFCSLVEQEDWAGAENLLRS